MSWVGSPDGAGVREFEKPPRHRRFSAWWWQWWRSAQWSSPGRRATPNQLGSFTISTVSPDTALAGANCDASFGGAGLGSWDYRCTHSELRRELGEEEWGRRLRADTRDYIAGNVGRLPVVVVARELRVWGLWNPADQVPREVVETRSEWFQWLAGASGLVVLVGGIAGLVRLGAGRRDVLVLWAPVAMVALTAVLTHGNTRFATAAQPVLAVGLAATVVAFVARQRSIEHVEGSDGEHRSGAEPSSESD